jgi:hypothetical protein
MGELHLRLGRLLAPQGAVVVEHRDALGLPDEVRTAVDGHRGDEVQDGALGLPGSPGRQRVRHGRSPTGVGETTITLPLRPSGGTRKARPDQGFDG